jgi:hypothetical protein
MQFDLNNDSKPIDDNRVQLFHRINSRVFNAARSPANGLAYECGAKNPAEDFLPSGLTNVVAHNLVKALSTLADAALLAIPVIGPGLVIFKQQAIAFAKKEGVDIEKALEDLLAQGVEGELFGAYLRSLPPWVPVDRKGSTGGSFTNADGKEVEIEIEGPLTRSFQTCRDVPFLQWNEWYNWTFQVAPIDGYAFAVGEGNKLSPHEQRDLLEPNEPRNHATDVYLENRSTGGRPHSIECLFDFGALCKLPIELGGGDHVTGFMFHPGWPFWPQSGDYFWAVGRWVYHCLHPSNSDKKAAKTTLFPTQVRPVKAFACTRYEGFKFDENEQPVAAVRFLFFATFHGGHLDFRDKGDKEGDTTCDVAFNDKDYEFILDLPEPPPSVDTYPIGHTPKFLANTLVLRPSLLMKLEFAPFGVPRSGAFFADLLQFESSLRPKVAIIPREKPNDPPRQVKVTIPLSQVPKGKDAYGVCISLGWFDADGTLASRVKKVTLDPGTITFDDKTSGDVRYHLCFNGRWFDAPFHDAGKRPQSLAGADSRFVQFIPDDSRVNYTSHGYRRNGFGDVMELRTKDKRTVFVGGIFRAGEVGKLLAAGGKVLIDKFGNEIDSDFVKELAKEGLDLLEGDRKKVEWKKHIDQDNKAVTSAVAREMFVEKVPLFNNMNEPLGLIEPNRKGSNPVEIKDQLPALVNNAKTTVDGGPFGLFVPITDVIGDADKLGVRLKGQSNDYSVRIVWTFEKQKLLGE